MKNITKKDITELEKEKDGLEYSYGSLILGYMAEKDEESKDILYKDIQNLRRELYKITHVITLAKMGVSDDE